MKIGWILSGNKDVAGARIQGWNIHKKLRKRGYSSEILYAPKGFAKFLELTPDERKKIIDSSCDVVFIQKIYDNGVLRDIVKSLRLKGVKIVYICMDRINEFLVDEADVIFVVSDYLKKSISPLNRKKVRLIFDGFEQDKKLFKKHTGVKSIKLVYLSNNVYDKFPKLNSLPKNVSLRIIGPPKKRVSKFNPENKIFENTPFTFEYVEWSIKNVNGYILDCDVAVLPYNDDLLYSPEIRRKSSNRIIYMMSLGLPVIASPTDEFKKLIISGKNGFLAIKEAEWQRSIMLLRDNPELRKKIGESARKAVLKKYSVDKQADEYEKILESLK